MNIYDKVYELANVLKDCPEVKEFREASKKIESNETSKKMLDDLREIQFEAYSEQVRSGEISNETKEKIDRLGSVISLNPDISTYLQSEARFGTMWNDIMKILNDAIDIDLTFGKEK